MDLGEAKLLKWPGGRHWDYKLILSLMPPHRIYVEPFCGSATVFFKKPLAEINVLGDINSSVIKFFNLVRQGALRKCPIEIRANKATFEKMRKKAASNICSFIAANKLSYHGSMVHYTGDRAHEVIHGVKKLYDPSTLQRYEQMLRRAYLTTRSFEDTMTQFDSPETFHFLDPPWMLKMSEKYRGGFSVSAEDIFRVSAQMQGKVLIIYNDSPETRKIFCRKPFRCKFHSRTATRNGKGIESKRLIAMNY